MFTPPLIVCCFLLLQIFWVVSVNISTPPFLFFIIANILGCFRKYIHYSLYCFLFFVVANILGSFCKFIYYSFYCYLQIFWVVSANISTPPFIVYCPQNWPQLLLPARPSILHLQQLFQNFSQNSLQYAAGKCQNRYTKQMYLSI